MNHLGDNDDRQCASGDERGALPATFGGMPVRTAKDKIIFGAPVIGKGEIDAVTACLKSGWIGLGPKVAQFEQEFASYKGASYAAAVNSGTAAIHLVLLALGIGPGDEVIAPTMTFCATVHSIIHVGAKPVLVDCDPVTFNIDVDAIEEKINRKTKAIMVVHLYGRCCEMDAVMGIAQKYGLRVIEDCAHAVESEYKGMSAGLIGDAGCFSFYATKSITTADGGMVITKDEQLHRNIKQLSLHGIDADAWTRQNEKGNYYQVVSVGYKYNMTDIEASIGIEQLKTIKARWEKRQWIWNTYNELLESLPVITPPDPALDTKHAYHLYTVLLDLGGQPSSVLRDEVVTAMKAENIGVGVHYNPIHMQPFYAEKYAYQASNFPVASSAGMRTFSLPLNADLDSEDVADVCRALRRILQYYHNENLCKGID